jgi:hypothetical protein
MVCGCMIRRHPVVATLDSRQVLEESSPPFNRSTDSSLDEWISTSCSLRSAEFYVFASFLFQLLHAGDTLGIGGMSTSRHAPSTIKMGSAGFSTCSSSAKAFMMPRSKGRGMPPM